MAVPLLLDLLCLLLVVGAAASDLATRRIPNRWLLAGSAGALTLQLFMPAPGPAFAYALAGMATGLLIFLPLYLLRGMAAGDVKLMAAVGAFSTPMEVLHIALLSMCAGGLMALLLVLLRGRLLAAILNVRSLLRPLLLRAAGVPLAPVPMAGPSVGSIPYGLAIACGTLWVIAQRDG